MTENRKPQAPRAVVPGMLRPDKGKRRLSVAERQIALAERRAARLLDLIQAARANGESTATLEAAARLNEELLRTWKRHRERLP